MELVEYCFRASPLHQKLLPIFSWEKSVLLPLKGYLPTFPLLLSEALQCICITVFILQFFLIIFREQNKVVRNQVSASICLDVFVKRPTFSLGELHLANATNRMRQKCKPFTAYRTHGTHISCCRLVWYKLYLPFNLCNLSTCPFLVSSSSLAENYSLLSHRNMKNILLSNTRREIGLNLKIRVVCVVLWAGCSRSTLRP